MKKTILIVSIVIITLLIIAGAGVYCFKSKADAFLPGNSLFQLKNISEIVYPYLSLNADGRCQKEKTIFDRRYSDAAQIYNQKRDKLYQPAIASLNIHLDKLNILVNKVSDQNKKVQYQKDLAEKSFLVLNLIDQMRGQNTNLLKEEVSVALSNTDNSLKALPEADRNAIIKKNSAIINSLMKNDPALAAKIDDGVKTIASSDNPTAPVDNGSGQVSTTPPPGSTLSLNSLTKDQVDGIVKVQAKGHAYAIKTTNVLKSAGLAMIGLVVDTNYPTFIYLANQTDGLKVVEISDENYDGFVKPTSVSDTDWQWLLHNLEANAKDGDIYFK